MKPDSAKKKYVFVLVHGDMWGAYNANELVKAVKERGAEPILIVSRSTPDKSGKPLTKVEGLLASRILKEEKMLRYFDLIEALEGFARNHEKLHKRSKKKVVTPKAEYLTFNLLGEQCAAHKVHFTTAGGKKGGEEIAAIFEQLKRQGITPEVVLSGDTLAILPETITGQYDCFGTHPGPLPAIKGMQGTERSLVNNVLYDRDGHYMEPGSYLPGGDTYVKGCFFNLAPKLDEGPVIAEALTPVCPGMDLFQIRTDLYAALVDKMIEHMGTLLDKPARKSLIHNAKARKKQSPEKDVPDLTQEALHDWQGDGHAYVHPGARLSDKIWAPQDTPDQVEIIQNEIVSPEGFKSRMADFFPGATIARNTRRGKEYDYSPEFNAAFEAVFRSALDNIVRQAQQAEGPDMRHTRRILRQAMRGQDIDTPDAEARLISHWINRANRGEPLDGPAHPSDKPIPFTRK